jgi:hypothetical protein
LSERALRTDNVERARLKIAHSAGDTILSAGEWSAHLGEHPVHGYWSTVSVRDGTQWKHRQNAFSIDPPPPASK